MTNEEKIKLIMEYVDDAYPIPGYFTENVERAITQALKVIEVREGTES